MNKYLSGIRLSLDIALLSGGGFTDKIYSLQIQELENKYLRVLGSIPSTNVHETTAPFLHTIRYLVVNGLPPRKE